MVRGKIVRALVLAFLVASLLVSLPAAVGVGHLLSEQRIAEAERLLERSAGLLARTVARSLEIDERAERSGPLLRRLSQETLLEMALFDAEGRIVAASNAEALPELDLSRFPIGEPSQTVAADALRGRREHLAVVVPLRRPAPGNRGPTLPYNLLVSESFGSLRAAINTARIIILLGSLLSALMAVAVSFLLADRITVPVFTELRRLESMRRDFVANVSHELKTPLTASQGMVETLIDDPEMEPNTRRLFLFKIRDQTTRLGALVDDLLTLSRIERAGEALDVQPIDLGDVIQRAIASRRHQASNAGVTIATKLQGERIELEADPAALEIAIVNLLDNGIKYAGEGERVEIRARRDGRLVVVSVEDSGPGIDAVHLDRIFERFYRVDAGRSRAVGGTGLGLAIVKHVALAHGGEVTVESEPEHGTCFRLSIPVVFSATQAR